MTTFEDINKNIVALSKKYPEHYEVTGFNSKCEQCGNDNDLMVAFTDYKVCGSCTRKNHKKATK